MKLQTCQQKPTKIYKNLQKNTHKKHTKNPANQFLFNLNHPTPNLPKPPKHAKAGLRFYLFGII